MNNWKDYVAFQPLNEELPNHYMTLVINDTTREDGSPGLPAILIMREKIDESEMTLTEDEVGQAVEDVLSTFPTQEIKSEVDLMRVKNEIARTCRRAHPASYFNGAWYYKGSSIYDSAIYVIGYKGKYAVKKHRDFDKYGFVTDFVSTSPMSAFNNTMSAEAK